MENNRTPHPPKRMNILGRMRYSSDVNAKDFIEDDEVQERIKERERVLAEEIESSQNGKIKRKRKENPKKRQAHKEPVFFDRKSAARFQAVLLKCVNRTY